MSHALARFTLVTASFVRRAVSFVRTLGRNAAAAAARPPWPPRRELVELEQDVRGDYLAGDAFTLADVSALPFLQRIHQEYDGFPDGCPRLTSWCATAGRRGLTTRHGDRAEGRGESATTRKKKERKAELTNGRTNGRKNEGTKERTKERNRERGRPDAQRAHIAKMWRCAPHVPSRTTLRVLS